MLIEVTAAHMDLDKGFYYACQDRIIMDKASFRWGLFMFRRGYVKENGYAYYN